MNEEENVVIDPAAHRQHGLGEKVASPERRGMTPQESGPRVVRFARRFRLEAIFSQDAIDGCPADRAVAESVEFTLDSARTLWFLKSR